MPPSVPYRPQALAPAISIAFPDAFLRRRVLITLLLLTALYSSLRAQTVTELITDYNGYWKSGQSAINAVKPDNSHNLVSFSYNGTRYSTGVNDALLTSRGQSFVAGDYKALPVYRVANASSNTKIGLGALYDGVHNGASHPRPANNIPLYLTDGTKGMDLGTGVANLPAGELLFAVVGVQAQLIGDGIPDLLITQIADPSGSLDSYEFADANGNRVGNKIDINLSTLPSLGNWTADFYDASTNPLSLSGGFTQTDRAIRLWAADFSAFGINASNIHQIMYFRIRLSGDSDVAFVAYNNQTFNVGSLLPATLAYFKGRMQQEEAVLTWQTVTELETAWFVIESSQDGVQFRARDSVRAAGTSYNARQYSWTDHHPAAGKTWYRLKQTDRNGTYTYSHLISLQYQPANNQEIQAYPNPASNRLVVKHAPATGKDWCTLRNLQGVVLARQKPATGSTQSHFDVQAFPAGTYLLVLSNGSEQYTQILVKK